MGPLQKYMFLSAQRRVKQRALFKNSRPMQKLKRDSERAKQNLESQKKREIKMEAKRKARAPKKLARRIRRA